MSKNEIVNNIEIICRTKTLEKRTENNVLSKMSSDEDIDFSKV